MVTRPVLALAMALFASAAVAAMAPPAVVTSIKPVHSLVAAVMGESGTPALLVDGAASPHAYSLAPSDARALQDADLVFWIGPEMELFLADALATLGTGATIIDLAGVPGLDLLPLREGGAFEGPAHAHHQHDDEKHVPAHGHSETGELADRPNLDMHFWLDPVNARHLLSHIATALAVADPEREDLYARNAAAAAAELTALETELSARLAPLRGLPFIVFHDAVQYLEHRFHLSGVGAVTVTPDTMPGAARIRELRTVVAAAGAVCVFAEPQFEPAIVSAIIEGTEARAGTLDPEGAELQPGESFYADLLRGLAADLGACLVDPRAP